MKMKKSKILATIILAVIMLLCILQLKVSAVNFNMIIVKQNDNQYLIYVKQIMNENFSFAFSNTKDKTQLNYITAEKDNKGRYIAYVDEELKNQFFNSENTYIWVETKTGETVIDGELIKLKEAKTIEQLNQIKNITKNITVQSSAEEEKIKINGAQDKTYYYQFSVANATEDYSKLLTLVNEISKYDENSNMFTKLQNYNELYELYNSLVANLKDEDWVKAENLEITKPYDAKQNQQYVLWLKDENGNLDIQFLTAYEKTVTTVVQKANVKEVATALPYTYDDTTILFIALGVVVIAIIAIIIFKKINKNTRKD